LIFRDSDDEHPYYNPGGGANLNIRKTQDGYDRSRDWKQAAYRGKKLVRESESEESDDDEDVQEYRMAKRTRKNMKLYHPEKYFQ